MQPVTKETVRMMLSSRRGAAMTETIVTTMLIGIFTIGSVSLFGDNIRALFSTADNSLAGVDSTPATRPGQAGSYNLKGLKNAGQAGEDAGRLAAMNAALKTAFEDPNVPRFYDHQVPARDPGEHPLYPGVRYPGFQMQKASWQNELDFMVREGLFRYQMAVQREEDRRRSERRARDQAARETEEQKASPKRKDTNHGIGFDSPFLKGI